MSNLSLTWKIIIFGAVCSIAFFALSFFIDFFMFFAIGAIAVTVLVLLGLLFKKLFID